MDIFEGARFIERNIPFTQYTVYNATSTGFREPICDKWHIGPFDEGAVDPECFGHMILTVHEIIKTEKSGTLAVYYRTFYNPEGEQNAQPKRKVTDIKALKSFLRQYKLEEWNVGLSA